uniref:Uncharacterized protein n=1 Tax=Siphoviridae sp. ct3r22 TaxID=2825325 RepID=A0A8S5V0Z9_9CAUD|nr:MAG TPA: hypothetical protein [Siphoviridae sp. ct3r22]
MFYQIDFPYILLLFPFLQRENLYRFVPPKGLNIGK